MIFESSKCDSNIQIHFKRSIEGLFFLEFFILKIRDSNIEWSHFFTYKQATHKSRISSDSSAYKIHNLFHYYIWLWLARNSHSLKLQKTEPIESFLMSSICKASFGLFGEIYCHDHAVKRLHFILLLSELLKITCLGMCSNFFS